LPQAGFAKTQENVVLRLHERTIPYKVAYWEQLGAKFTETHPNVEFQVQADGVGNEYNEKILAQLSGGTIGDLFWLVNVENYSAFQARGVLHPLNEFIEADGYDLSVYLQNALDIHTQNDQLYILPTGVHGGPWLQFYNVDMFEAAGVEVPPLEWTWDNFRDMSVQLADATGVFGCAMPVRWGEFLDGISRSFGGEILNEDGTESLILEENTHEAFRYLDSLINELGVHPRPTDIPEGDISRLFQAEQVAMFNSGPWEVYELRESIEEGALNWDTTLIPNGPAGRGGELVTEGYAIPTQSENKEMAWEFIKLMCSREEGIARIAEGFIAPPREDALLAPELMADPVYALYQEELVANTPTGPHLPHNNRVSEYYQLMQTGFDPLWLGDVGVDEMLESIHQELEALLSRPSV
jgi:multiple sugar transport system substrate-binding protein